jgi:hypothetical protein
MNKVAVAGALGVVVQARDSTILRKKNKRRGALGGSRGNGVCDRGGKDDERN